MSVEFFHRNGLRARTSMRTYPGGEALVDVQVQPGEDQIAFVRGASPHDLVDLAVWSNSVRRMGGNPIGFLPYLPGARADHDEHAGGFDAAAYARLINAAELDQIVCVDPHSSVMPSMLDRCSVVHAVDLSEHMPAVVGLIASDEGAHDRVSRVAERLSLPIFQARKHRDFNTGKLSGFTCESLPDEGAFLVVDDICDGGGTFRGLAAAAEVESGVGCERMHLWATHGIFSGSARDLTDYFCTITTTDSHWGCRNIPEARVVNLLPHLMGRLDQGAPS